MASYVSSFRVALRINMHIYYGLSSPYAHKTNIQGKLTQTSHAWTYRSITTTSITGCIFVLTNRSMTDRPSIALTTTGRFDDTNSDYHADEMRRAAWTMSSLVTYLAE